MKRFRLLILTAAITLGASAALADDLNLGGLFVNVTVDESGVGATNVGGGPISVSLLNGSQLAYVYCVGFFTDVQVPADYSNTLVTSNGMVKGASATAGVVNPALATVNNAAEIAWLLGNFAAGSIGNGIKEQALQAAIWTVEYNGTGGVASLPTIHGDSGQAYYSQYISDITALDKGVAFGGGVWSQLSGANVNTASLDTISWFSPANSSGSLNQGLVGPGPSPVPEPTSVLLLGTTLLLAGKLMKRKQPRTE